MNHSIVCNTRVLSNKSFVRDNFTSGVQRYTFEILNAMTSCCSTMEPVTKLNGFAGHMWEQVCLPYYLAQEKSPLLWSPSNSGPLGYKNQVITLHDLVPFDHPQWLNPTFGKWYRFITPKLLNSVKHVITISEFTKSRILDISNIPENKISVVHNGVDDRFYRRNSEQIEAVKQFYGLGSKPFILSLASLQPRKNLNRLVDAWNLIKSQVDANLVIAGGWGNSNVYQKIDIDTGDDSIKLIGHVSDELLPSLYSAAICFVYPSVYEGFGLPPLEAMACETPVIVGSLTSLPEVVGEAGLLVDPYSKDEIAETILTVYSNSELRANLSKAGKVRSKIFTWKDAARKIESILQNYS